MKKIGILLIVILLMMPSFGFAEVLTLDSPFQNVTVTLDLPQNMTACQKNDNDMLLVDVTNSQEAQLEYHVIVTKSDLEGYADRSLADLSEDELSLLVSLSAAELDEYNYYVHTTDDATMYFVIDEAGDTDENTAIYTLINGYLVGIRGDYHGSQATMTEQDYRTTIELLDALSFTFK